MGLTVQTRPNVVKPYSDIYFIVMAVQRGEACIATNKTAFVCDRPVSISFIKEAISIPIIVHPDSLTLNRCLTTLCIIIAPEFGHCLPFVMILLLYLVEVLPEQVFTRDIHSLGYLQCFMAPSQHISLNSEQSRVFKILKFPLGKSVTFYLKIVSPYSH